MTSSSVVAPLLAGVAVIEHGGSVAVGFCGRQLVDLGATVRRVESEGTPDEIDPDLISCSADELRAFQSWMHAGKLRFSAAAFAADSAFEGIDALIDNGDCASRPRPPWLIYVSVSPFGANNPYPNAVELNSYHYSGLGHRYLGEPDREPLKPGFHLGHYFGGINAAFGLLAALFERGAHSGLGQAVEVSETECLATFILANGLVTKYWEDIAASREPEMMQRAPIPLTQQSTYPCRDGYVRVSALEAQHWERFLHVLGDPWWAEYEVFKGSSWDRAEYLEELDRLVSEWTTERSKHEVFEACLQAGVPCAIVSDMHDLLTNPQLAARDFFRQVDAGPSEIRVPGRPYRLSS